MITIDSTRCCACGACARDCIVKIITCDAGGRPSVDAKLAPYCLKCQHCFAVCPNGAIAMDGRSPDSAAPMGPVPTEETMMNLVRQRRSVRQWRREDVSSDQWKTLAAASKWCPTGCNDHRLHFAFVKTRAEMDGFRMGVAKMIRALERFRILTVLYPRFRSVFQAVLDGEDVIFRDAPGMIVISTPKNAPCREADPWIAGTTLGLLAESMGLGTCWCGFGVHTLQASSALRKRLGVPKGYRLASVLLVGHPAVTYARATSPV